MNLLRCVSPLAIASCALSAQAVVVTTVPDWDGTSYLDAFGNPNTTTYGQTFGIGTARALESFSATFEGVGGDPFGFSLYVAAWDDATLRAVGPILFSSGTLASAPVGAGPVTYDVAVGLALQPGRYVAFWSTSGQAARPEGAMQQAITDGSAYSRGTLVYFNDGGNLSRLFSEEWDGAPTFYDSAFSMTLSGVPGPAAALPFALMALKRRKR